MKDFHEPRNSINCRVERSEINVENLTFKKYEMVDHVFKLIIKRRVLPLFPNDS